MEFQQKFSEELSVFKELAGHSYGIARFSASDPLQVSGRILSFSLCGCVPQLFSEYD